MEGEKTKLQPGPINDDDDDDNFLRVHMNIYSSVIEH